LQSLARYGRLATVSRYTATFLPRIDSSMIGSTYFSPSISDYVRVTLFIMTYYSILSTYSGGSIKNYDKGLLKLMHKEAGDHTDRRHQR
jgi:hypothetical protein